MITIREAIFTYAKLHDHRIPLPSGVAQAGLSAYLPSGSSWPVDPYAGQPMRAGTGLGEYIYDRLGSHVYTIDSFGTDGKSVWSTGKG